MAAIRVVAVSPSNAAVTLASALFLLSTGVAARRAIGRGDASEAAFVAAAAVLVAALLAAVRAHDEGEGHRRRRGLLLRAVVWALSAALTAMFARRVSALVPAPAVVALVWTMAGATVTGGFGCLFVRGRGEDADGVGHDARAA